MDIRSRQLKKLGREGKVGGWRDGGRGPWAAGEFHIGEI